MEHRLDPTPARVAPNPAKNPEAAAKIVMGKAQFLIPQNTPEEYNKAVNKCLSHIKIKEPPKNQAIEVHNFGNNGGAALQKLLEKSKRLVIPGNIEADEKKLKAAFQLLQNELKKSKKPLTPEEFTHLFLQKLKEQGKKPGGTIFSVTSEVTAEQEYDPRTRTFSTKQKPINPASVIGKPPSRTTTQDINTNAKNNLAQHKPSSPQSPTPFPSSAMTLTCQPNSWINKGRQKKKEEEEQQRQASTKTVSTPFDIPKPFDPPKPPDK